VKLAGASIARALSTPDPGTRFYLFYGPDEAGSRALADRLLGALGAEKFAIAGSSVKGDPASLADEAGAMALFGGPRAIWIEPAGDEIVEGVEALLDAPSVESAVIAIGGALRKTSPLVKLAEAHARAAAAISYVPEGRDAARLVVEAARGQGLRVEPDIAERIATDCGGNQAVIGQELIKFALYLDASPETPKVLGHDVLDAVGAESAEGNHGRIGDCALDGDLSALYDEFDRAALAPNEVIPVVRALQRRLLQLAPMRARIERGERPDAVLTSLGKALFWKDKPLVGRLLRTWNAARLAELVERSSAIESGVMLSGQPPLAALGEEAVTIARATKRLR
jgi:DNA polymerase-3 subunit delta